MHVFKHRIRVISYSGGKWERINTVIQNLVFKRTREMSRDGVGKLCCRPAHIAISEHSGSPTVNLYYIVLVRPSCL